LISPARNQRNQRLAIGLRAMWPARLPLNESFNRAKFARLPIGNRQAPIWGLEKRPKSIEKSSYFRSCLARPNAARLFLENKAVFQWLDPSLSTPIGCRSPCLRPM
jgi:hypothetical protein